MKSIAPVISIPAEVTMRVEEILRSRSGVDMKDCHLAKVSARPRALPNLERIYQIPKTIEIDKKTDLKV